MRIVYIIDSLAQKGGAERVISEKMNYLATHFDYDVSVITCYQFPNMPNCYDLSNNLCILSHQLYKYNYPKRFWIKLWYSHQLYKRLTETAKTIHPDIIIGVGYTLADYVCCIKYKAAKIIEAHEARIFTKASFLYKDFSPISKIVYKLSRKRYLHIIEKKADVIVTLTKDDAQNWKKAKRVEIIPYFSVMPINRISDGTPKRVIAIGRLSWQKGYDRLLDIWKIVSAKHPDWFLDIYGEGVQETELKNAIKEIPFNNISIQHFTKNISMEYANSSICVLTSRYEGFSLVLLEAMRHGLLCITFDCTFGHKDLVDHEKCGFVIENGNIYKFADKLCYLIDNPDIRKKIANSAIKKTQSYQVDTIMKQWTSLFHSLT